MRFYKFCLWKAYFDKGMGLTSYLKYAVALFAVKFPLKLGIIVGVSYFIFCLILGRVWYYYRIIDTENEIGNIFNPFTRDVRKSLKIKRKRNP